MLAILAQIGDFIVNHLMASSSVIAVIVEFILRIFPTVKPQSLMLIMAEACKSLADIFTALSQFINAIIPQNLAK